jgi:hypothetical protein
MPDAGIPLGLSSGVNSPSGIRTGSSQGNSPISAQLGAPSSQNQAPTYTSQNTQPGPPIYQWDNYDFMLNAYFSEGGFHDGSALVKSQVEKDVQYIERRANSYYKNYVREIIDATYIPVFSKPAKRLTLVSGSKYNDSEGKAAPTWFAFKKNTDNRGTSIEAFTRLIVRYARILGVSFIVMDNFQTTPELTEDAIKNRKFPFVAMRLPQQVNLDLLVLDEFLQIEQIAFREKSVQVGDTLEERWKLWTRNYSVMMTKDKDGKYIEVPGTRYEYNLGRVPVIPVYSAECEHGTILPMPSFYSIARCNWKLFNTCSAQDRLMRAQMFCILCAPKVESGFSASPNQGFELPANDGTTGINYPLPFYLAPPTGPYGEISQNIKDLATDLFQLAGQQGITGVKTEASGISAAYDWQGQEWVLKQTSNMAKFSEEEIAKLFMLYVSEKFEYTAEYETDFQVIDQQAKGNQFGRFLQDVSSVSTPYTPLVAEALKEYAKGLFDGMDEEKFADIVQWIDDNTSTAEPGSNMPPVDDNAAANDKVISFLKDQNRVPNALIKKPPVKKKESVAA